jgi:hypothetical protein
MADKLLYEYGRNAAANGVGSPPDWPAEGWDSDEVNNFIRAFQAAAKLFYDEASWVRPFEGAGESWTLTKVSDTVLRISGPRDVTDQFPDERRVRFTDDVAATVEGFVTGASYSDPDNDITVELDSGVVSANTEIAEISVVALKRPAFTSFGTSGALAVKAEDVATILGIPLPLGTASEKDHGTLPDEIPLNSNLGSAALLDWGVGVGDLVKSEDIPGLLGELASDDRPFRKWVPITTFDSENTNATWWWLTDWQGVAITPADSVKLFRVTVIGWIKYGYQVEIGQVLCGPSGDATDVTICSNDDIDRVGGTADSSYSNNAWPAGGNDQVGFYMSAIVQPDAGDLISVRLKNDSSGGSGTPQIAAASAEGSSGQSLLLIEEIIGEEP